MWKRPFYDLLPTIECHAPRTVQCLLAEDSGMQIYERTKHGSYDLDKVLNFSSVQRSQFGP